MEQFDDLKSICRFEDLSSDGDSTEGKKSADSLPIVYKYFTGTLTVLTARYYLLRWIWQFDNGSGGIFLLLTAGFLATYYQVPYGYFSGNSSGTSLELLGNSSGTSKVMLIIIGEMHFELLLFGGGFQGSKVLFGQDPLAGIAIKLKTSTNYLLITPHI